MLQVKTFIFNAFQVNTYLLYDETKECVIIDAACYPEFEKNQLQAFIDENELKPVKLLNTHCHIDHILGNICVFRKFGLKPVIHKSGLPFLEKAKEHAWGFGFELEEVIQPESYIKEGSKIKFGNSEIDVIYTPGHADGSVCFISHEKKAVFVGDVLFKDSIGRTDLPTGDYKTLIENIDQKLFTLPEDYIVYPGHGDQTTIKQEKEENPYVGGDFL
jgi:hydroxyacylglutathione hydrolase